MERIFKSVTSYTTESNEDIFKPDIVFDSFHHQTKTHISDRDLLAGFLMSWLKKCVVTTLPHEIIVADVAYPVILLTYGWSFGLFFAMVGYLQSGLRVLCQSFCNMVVEEDKEGTSSDIGMVNRS